MLTCENLSDQLVNVIGRQIIQNELKSGEPITETKISKEWDVSRSPAKIALRVLERKKLVVKPLKGSYRVTELTSDFVDQFYDTVSILYQYSFIQAAERITVEDANYCFSILGKINENVMVNDFEFYVEGISRLLQKVLQINQNKIIEEVVDDLTPTIERLHYAAIEVSPLFIKDSLYHLRECYKYLYKNNSQKASNAYLKFSNTSRKVLLDHLKTKEEKRIHKTAC